MARKTKEEAQETRNAILDAAERVFQERGVSHTSLSGIAIAAGVTRGAVYWHFRNKADLYEAIFKRVFDPLEARVAEIQQNTTGNPVDALRAIARYFFGRIVSEPRFARLLDICWLKCEYVGEMARIRDAHLESGNRYLALNEAAFRLARERGFLLPTVVPRCAAIGYMAVIDGLVVNWTLDPALFPLERYGAAVVDAFLNGLCAPPRG
jgi:TetR/AcrR family transcriptional regulator, acrAB operon repressor